MQPRKVSHFPALFPIFPTPTDQNANKHPQNSTKKPEHPHRSGFFALFCPIEQSVLHRMLMIAMVERLQKEKFRLSTLSRQESVTFILE